MVEQDYDNLLPSVHGDYDATTEFRDAIELFAQRVPQNGRLLNVGGAAAECNYFLARGLDVDDVDLSQEMIDQVSKHSPKTKTIKRNIKFYTSSQLYDGIWACRSLIHIPPSDLLIVLKNLHALLKDDGRFGAVFFSTDRDHAVEEETPEKYASKEGIKYYRSLYPRDVLLDHYGKAGLTAVHVQEVEDVDGDEGWFVLARHTST